MAGQIESDIKNICLERMIYAVCYSVAMQYLLLVIFLLLVNFSLFHPVHWLGSSLSALFSIYTWIWTTPLISSVLFYGLLLCRTYLAEPTYYRTRYEQLKKTLWRKVGFCFMHGIVGLFTAWLYTKFLSERYLYLSFKCERDRYCLNEKYLFLIISGSCSGFFHFFRINRDNALSLMFSVINLPKYVQIRSYFYTIFYQSMIDTIVPTICYIFGYLIVRRVIVNQTLYLFDLMEDPLVTNSIANLFFDFKLIFLVWILTSQIISNMNLMRVLFNIFLTEKYQFPIEKENISSFNVILLHEALSVKTLKIAFQLSSLDLFDLAHSHLNFRRKQIFSLSIPGGHPYNWKNIVTKVLEITNNYNKELSASLVKSTSNGNLNSGRLAAQNHIQAGGYPGSVLGEKYLLRHYNDSFGIRNISLYNNATVEPIVQQSPVITNQTKVQTGLTQFHELINQSITTFKQYIANLPGIYYLFTEEKMTKTNYLLSQSQPIVWLVQGISKLATNSLTEDNYGVVQGDLVKIIVTLLELKKTIDSITPLDLGGKKVDRNYISLKNATKRSLYQICTAFSDYMNDLIPDTELLKLLYNFVYYKEM